MSNENQAIKNTTLPSSHNTDKKSLVEIKVIRWSKDCGNSACAPCMTKEEPLIAYPDGRWVTRGPYSFQWDERGCFKFKESRPPTSGHSGLCWVNKSRKFTHRFPDHKFKMTFTVDGQPTEEDTDDDEAIAGYEFEGDGRFKAYSDSEDDMAKEKDT